MRTLAPIFRTRHLQTASLSLIMALSLSVSHQALAACSTTSNGANDTVTCDPAAGEALSTGAGMDSVTISSGSTGAVATGNDADDVTIDGTGGTGGNVTTGNGDDRVIIDTTGTVNGNVQGQAGDDVLVLIDGTINGNLNGDGGNSDNGPPATLNSGSDRIFMFGGTVTGEVQNGPGDENFTMLFGGTVEGTVEMQRGTKNSVIVIDGATVLGGIEMQNANTATNGQLAENPTVYMRSGYVGAGTWGNANDSTFIIDPVNSQDPDQYRDVATSGENPSTEEMNDLIANGEENPNEDHMLVIGPAGGDDDDDGGGGDDEARIAFDGGNDTVTFIGAVNNGDGRHNLHFGEVPEDGEYDDVEEEVPIFDGDGDRGVEGDADTINVAGESNLLLGEIFRFERLGVWGGSLLTLTGEEYIFGSETTGAVIVDGTSELALTGTDVTFTTGHFELQAGEGRNSRLAGLPDYYDSFDTGGVLTIGNSAAPDGDEDDEPEAAAEEDGEDDGETPTGEPVEVSIITGGSTFVNNGTINMLNGVAGDELSITGPYVSNGGNLAIDTFLGDSGSDSDELEIDGSVSGTTVVYVNNTNPGPGAFTGQGDTDGIEIAEVENGTFAPNSFILAVNAGTGRREVVNGPFSYQLRVTETQALLQSDLLDQVPAYTVAGSVVQRYASTGLDSIYKRVGEIRRGQNPDGDKGAVWVRGNYADFDVDPDAGFAFSQSNRSVMVGANTSFASESTKVDFGLFAGYGAADADVSAIIFGAPSVSNVQLDGWSAGAYVTFSERNAPPGIGFYLDGVIKADFTNLELASNRGQTGATDSDSVSVSGEVGYGFALGGNLVVQPQAQLAFTDVAVSNFTDSAPYNLLVSYQAGGSLIGRLGLHVQADYGSYQPYVVFNVVSEFDGQFASSVNTIAFDSDIGGTWYTAGAGLTAAISNSVSLYGQTEYAFGDVEGWQGSGGLRVNW